MRYLIATILGIAYGLGGAFIESLYDFPPAGWAFYGSCFGILLTLVLTSEGKDVY